MTTRLVVRVGVTLAAVAVGVALVRIPRARLIDMRSAPADQLPWGDVVVSDGRLAQMADGSRLLYVLPSCQHCDSAVKVFTSGRSRAGLERLVVAGAGREEAEVYGRRFSLDVIGLDSSRAFARGAGIRLVPTLVSVRDSMAVVTPVPSLHWLRRELARR